MPRRRIRLTPPDAAEIAAALAELRESLAVSLDLPGRVLADAEAVGPRAAAARRRRDHDPLRDDRPTRVAGPRPGAPPRAHGKGYRVRYAIADVAAFVTPGGPMDPEAHARGQTLYAPDENARLYPPQLSEGAGSLLPDETRPALLWTMEVDATGEGVEVDVRRALVRSRGARLRGRAALARRRHGRERLTAARGGPAPSEREARRGGINLPIPEQVVDNGAERVQLAFRAPLPVEGWNAQISLMTGQAAAELMLDARVGVLRTLPTADRGASRGCGGRRRRSVSTGNEARVRRSFIRTLDPERAGAGRRSCRVHRPAARLRLRGLRRRGADAATHAGVGAVRAHDGPAAPPRRPLCRRGLRRGLGGRGGPEWVRAALPACPETMERSNRRAQQYEAGILSTVEAAVLARSVGEMFEAVVVDVDEHGGGGTVQLPSRRSPRTARGEDLPLGERVEFGSRLADVAKRQVRFALA